ncbi:Uncharacterised protein [Mycobacteroides abscessus]|nr:Uncharacterised protein [Mycobacteroides abscessus]
MPVDDAVGTSSTGVCCFGGAEHAPATRASTRVAAQARARRAGREEGDVVTRTR